MLGETKKNTYEKNMSFKSIKGSIGREKEKVKGLRIRVRRNAPGKNKASLDLNSLVQM